MINFAQVLKDMEGADFTDAVAQLSDGKAAGKPLTLGRAASHALTTSYPDEPNVSGEEKFRRGALAYDIRDKKDAELPAEDVALIKKMIAKLYGPAVVFAAWPLLDKAVGKKDAGKSKAG